jgi:hypothetical protein
MNFLLECTPFIFGLIAGILMKSKKNLLLFTIASCIVGFLCNRLTGESLTLLPVDLSAAIVPMIVVWALKQKLIKLRP